MIGPYMTYESEERAYDIVKDLVRREKELVGIYVAGGGQQAAARALARSGQAGRIHMICHDTLPDTIRYVKERVVDFAIGQEMLVSEEFRTSTDERGNTYIYAQGNTNYPPAGKMPKDGFFFDNITRSDATAEDDDLNAREDYKDDFKVFTDEELRFIQDDVNNIYENTGYGMIYNGALCGIGDFALVPGPHVCDPKGIRDLQEFMMVHHLDPDYIHEIYEMQLEVALKNAELLYQAVGNKIQAVYISGTDFGLQRGPYMALEAFQEFYKPVYAKINGWIHEHTEWKTFFHSCGSIVTFLKDFHECGIDILNPVQTTAAGMDARMLKEQWGDKFTFWGGGINTQQTLPFGTPEECYNEAMERLEIFAPGGGFVFNTVHNIQGQTPMENMVAMFQAVKDYNAKIKAKG